MNTKMQKVLYVDVPFLGLCGGDKNRSTFLYESLYKKYDTDILLVLDKHYSRQVLKQHKNKDLYLIKNTSGPFYQPKSLHIFNEDQINTFKKILLRNQYQTIFFKFNSMGLLANIAKETLPFSNIIIDVDMLSSRICYEAWKNNKSIKNRYFLFEYLKLSYFENSFLNKDFTYLYTNKTEMELVQEKHSNIKQHHHLPNVFKEVKEVQSCLYKKRFILFYGMLNSTVNETAYTFLIQEIYPLIKKTLKKQNIQILVIGKNKTSTYKKDLENISILGEVEDLNSYIKQCEFVLLPLKIASGTLTRILETAFLKKTVLTSPIGAEGLDMNQAIFIEQLAQGFARKISQLLTNPLLCEKTGLKAYEYVKTNHSQNEVSKQLYTIIETFKRKKINVIHIPRRFTSSHWGGTENVVLSYALGLKRFQVESEVFTTKILNTVKKEEMQGIKIHRFSYFYPYLNLKNKLKEQLDLIGGNIFSFTLFFSLLFKPHIDLIHLHTFKRLGGIARLVCKLRNIPYIVSIHGGIYNRQVVDSDNKKESFNSSFEWGKILGFLVGSRRVIKDSNAIICLNNNEYERLNENLVDKQIFLIPNSVDISSFAKPKNSIIRKKYNLQKDAYICLVSARIDEQKNQLLLLKVINKIKHLHKNIQVILVGNITDKTYHSVLLDYINNHELENYVTLISDIKPNSTELLNIYLNADVLILPSTHEPFGIVALEAWASSLPVIISNIAGVCNVMEDKKDALIFENNSLSSLEETLSSLILNKTLETNLIKNAQQSVLAFDTNVINSQIHSIYTKVLQER